MLEDGLEDFQNLLDLKDLEEDTIGAKYLRMANTVSFSNISAYTFKLPASEHGKLTVSYRLVQFIVNIL